MKAKNKKENESVEFSKFIKLLIVVVVLLVGVYALTTRMVNKEETKDELETNEVSEFDYNKTLIGSMFNLGYKDYYVIIYDSTSRNASLVSDLVEEYRNKNDLKIFYVDLDDGLNKPYYDENNSNKNAKNASEVKVKDLTLIRFKDNKITEYQESFKDVYEKLK